MNELWQTTYLTPAATEMINILNNSEQAAEFISDISNYTGIPKHRIIIPTYQTQHKYAYSVPLKVLNEYFEQPGVNKYIHVEHNYPVAELVEKHYTVGKAEPAYYMQAGDDFYKLSDNNPLSLPPDVPKFDGLGNFKIRISTRSKNSEVQAEIKVKHMIESNYSCKPGTNKKNPFIC